MRTMLTALSLISLAPNRSGAAKPAAPTAPASFDPKAYLASLTPDQRAALAKEARGVVKDERSATRGRVGEVMLAEDDANRLWIGVDLGNAPGTTLKGEAYLLRTDAFTFKHTDGKTYRLGNIYAIEVKA